MNQKVKIGITMGDPAGIGAEIILKALNNKGIYRKCIPIVIGDKIALDNAINYSNLPLKIKEINSIKEAKGEYGTVDCINLKCLERKKWEYKKPQKTCGQASFQYITHAIKLALKNEIEAVITAPINKESLHLSGNEYSGHTEIFAKYTKTKKYAMILANKNFRVIHVSTHVPLKEACELVKKERIYDVINLANESLKLMGIEKPTIGVAGLNPHCSENGLFGKEEKEEIIPAIEKARNEGINVFGPEAPDTVFIKCASKVYDIVVAMYHDQGHIPIKFSGFKMDSRSKNFISLKGINYTAGLPIIRVSVDHGTAYHKAGEGRANEDSMLEAIQTGILIAKNKRRMKNDSNKTS